MTFHWYYILIIYLVIMNIIGFATMLADKKRAIHHEWRIKEATLFIVAILGGSLGSIIGMYSVRHKTRHWYFVVGMPLILIVWIALIIWVSLSYGSFLDSLFH